MAALALLRLIGLITNLVFYQRMSTRLIAPGAGHHQPLLILLAPVAGGLIVGLMARFGSEKIRGHGMPEAIEAILVRGSRVEPRVAVLKPISAADQHRHRRPVRRRGTDHHDRRRGRLGRSPRPCT